MTVEVETEGKNLTPQGRPNLKRGNTVGVGRKPGESPPSPVLSDFRHVYTRPEKEDDTEGRRNMRAYLREKPMEFMRQMVQLEIQHRNRSKKGVEAAAASAVLVGPVVEGSKEAREEFEDEGQGRMEDWLKRVREDYDHERAKDVGVSVLDGDGGRSGVGEDASGG